MEKLGIAVVGLGSWGRNYVKTLIEYNTCQLFVSDIDEEVLKNFQTLQIVSFSELLANDRIEALIIATPDHTHFQLTVSALAAGKDVLVEKPMAISIAEAEEILHFAQKWKRIVAVGHTPIYSSSFDLLKSQIDQITMKDIIRIEAVRTSQGRGNGSDVLWDLAAHDLAMTICLFGFPKSVSVIERERDYCRYQVIFDNNVEFTGTVSWCEPPFRREIKVYTMQKVHHFQEPIGINGKEPNPPLKRLCSDFIHCCNTRRKPLSDVVLGLNVVKCLALLSRESVSIETRRVYDAT